MADQTVERPTMWASVAKMLPLIVILGLWLGIRVLFKTDIVTPESGRNVRIAYEIATALKDSLFSGISIAGFRQALGQIAAQYGWRSIALNAVIAPGYALFGVNTLTTLWLAYLGSLVGLGCVYVLTQHVAGKPAAYLAAFLWALLPVEIFYASTLLRPVLAFSSSFLGVVLLVLTLPRIEKSTYKLLLGLGGLLLLLWAVAISPAGWVTFVFLLLYFSWQRFGQKSLGIGGIVVGLVWVFLAGRLVLVYDLADISTASLGKYLLQNLPLVLYLCLAIGALVQMRSDWRPEGGLVLLWLGTTLPFYGLYGFMDAQAVFLEPLALLTMLAAMYAADGLNRRDAVRLMVSLSIGTSLLLTIGKLTRQSFLMPINPRLNWQWLSPDLLLDFSKIAMGLAILGCLLSPLVILGKPTRWKKVGRVLVLSVIALALVDPIVTTYQDKDEILANARLTLDVLTEQNPALPLYVDSQETADYFAYVAGYERQTAQALSNDVQVENGYIVLPYYATIEPEPQWFPLQQVGTPGQGTFWVFRALSPEKAHQVYATTRLAVEANPTADDFWQLYGAALNAGEFCEAYTAWIQYFRLTGSDAMQFIPVTPDSGCFQPKENSMIEDKYVNDLREYWITQQGSLWTASRQDSGRLILNWDSNIWTAFTREVVLDPNSVYFYEIVVQSDVPLVTLIYKVGDNINYLDARKIYKHDYTLSILIATPNWPGTSPLVTLAPIIFLDAGSVERMELNLYRVDLELP